MVANFDNEVFSKMTQLAKIALKSHKLYREVLLHIATEIIVICHDQIYSETILSGNVQP